MTKRKKSKVAKYEQLEVKVIKKGPETPEQRMNRERAEFYDLAERCRAAGDEAGYCGYMSALGDIGR